MGAERIADRTPSYDGWYEGQSTGQGDGVVPVTIAAMFYLLGLGASTIEYGPQWIPLYLATAVVAAVVGHIAKGHTWRVNRSRAGRSTTGLR
jgi:hypothetical protein